MKLTTNLHLVPTSKNEWSYTPLPNTPSWRGAHLKTKKEAQGQLYYYYYSLFINFHLPTMRKIKDTCTLTLECP